jgi:hypothetical protein
LREKAAMDRRLKKGRAKRKERRKGEPERR